MSIRPWVVVDPPDSRGLRRVVVGGEPVGTAWSLRELRRMLVRLGYPASMDLEDPAAVYWRGGGSTAWPDRPWRRRTVTLLMTAGLLASMVLNTLIGRPDALGALTFAQRVTGALFVVSGAVLGAAAVAALDHCGRRRHKNSGAVVLLGVLITLATGSLLLVMWFEETEFTPYVPAFTALWCWSLWALWLLVRERAWQGMPRPRTFAAGLAATALVSAVSLAYSTMYQPTAAPMHFVLKAEFGKSRLDRRNPYVHVPLKLYIKNDGRIPVHIINDDYSVYGRTAEYSDDADRLAEWRRSLDEGREVEAERYVDRLRFLPVSSGRFYPVGGSLDVGQEYATEHVFQIPKDPEFDTINIVLQITYMRKDRGKLDVSEFRRAHRSWDKREGRYYCRPEKCGEELYYHGRVRHNNNLVNVTREPRYVTAVWGPGQTPDYSVSTFHFEGPVARSEEKREEDRYGVSTRYIDTSVPVAALLEEAAD
ncbi:hypothetical protein N4P33_32455 [Streptomyces sp. 15-116A]|uniref:hypothetical protein n=1 Tax=Streptomyces sp. 15-116A TaxID=2259035 RepID=UPI0021B41443|nr:hypothetical protein [Streptomyces sp. 15-116A]MCT7356819.1 hypothetical protein [Streptomyces sp. 15-116A]